LFHPEQLITGKEDAANADDLTDQSVQVGVGWSLNVQVTSADIVDGFIVYHESTV
jgi:hypothetical protein